jgi:hypothetical protein
MKNDVYQKVINFWINHYFTWKIFQVIYVKLWLAPLSMFIRYSFSFNIHDNELNSTKSFCRQHITLKYWTACNLLEYHNALKQWPYYNFVNACKVKTAVCLQLFILMIWSMELVNKTLFILNAQFRTGELTCC